MTPCVTVRHFVMFASLCAALPLSATADDYFPLETGKKWKLRLSSGSQTMIYEVLRKENESSVVRWQNPWLPKVEFRFRRSGQRILLSALDMGEGVGDLPPDTVYFDFSAADGSKWSNSLGSFQMVSRKATVSTTAGRFENCLHIRLTHPDKVVFSWYFAPGRGIVQFGEGNSAFFLADGSEAVRPVSAAATTSKPRLFGIDINVPEDGDYQRVFDLARATGASTVSLTVNWSDVEISPGKMAPNPNWFQVANEFYPSRGMKVDLILSPFDPAGKRLPKHLQNLPMDSATVIAGYKKLVDFAFKELADTELNYVAVGNEVDLGLGTDEKQWSQFTRFVKQVVPYIQSKRPGLKVGVPGTLYGMIGPNKNLFQQLVANCPVVLVTYYPLKDDFLVKDPTVVPTEIKDVLSAYPIKPVAIVETGYPTASSLGSSKTRQVEFVRQVFKAWDQNPRIWSVVFSWMTDLSTSEIEHHADYYKLDNSRFKDYLRTLGLRTWNGKGSDKPAFVILKSEAASRGLVP